MLISGLFDRLLSGLNSVACDALNGGALDELGFGLVSVGVELVVEVKSRIGVDSVAVELVVIFTESVSENLAMLSLLEDPNFRRRSGIGRLEKGFEVLGDSSFFPSLPGGSSFFCVLGLHGTVILTVDRIGFGEGGGELPSSIISLVSKADESFLLLLELKGFAPVVSLEVHRCNENPSADFLRSLD